MKKYSLSIFISLFAVFAGRAQDMKFSLTQAVEYAIKNSPSYLNAELDLQNAVYRKDETRGLGLPQINGSIDVKDYLSIPTSLIPGDFVGQPGTYIPVKFGTKYNSTVGLSASQLLFSSDYIFALQASKQFLDLSRISVTRTKAELTAAVSKAYYGVVISKDRMKILDANVTRLKKLYEDTRAINQQGLVELIDVERLQVQYNNLVTERDKIQRILSLSEITLKFQMGIDLNKEIMVTDSLRSGENFEDLEVGKVDVSQRPEYKLLQAQQYLYDLDMKRLKYGYAPTLVAYGSYQYNAQRNQFNFFSFDSQDPTKQWFKIALIGATLNVNIFDGLQRHNKIQQAKISSLKNRNLLRQTELGTQLEATGASITYKNAFVSLGTQKKNMELAQHVYDVAQKKYEAGVGSNIEFINAQVSLQEAQSNYFVSLYDAAVAKIDYQKAVGTLVK
jgi:outer membrane protein